MLPILQVGPLAVQVPGLVLLAGVWVGSILAERAAEDAGVAPAQVANLIFYGLIAGVIGARLGYALRFLSVYLQDPLGLISLNPSTLALPEGVLAGALVAAIYGQRRGMALWPTLDTLAPGAAAFSVALGVAHLASGDAFGAASNVPWAIDLWGASRHPTQVYEIGLALAVLYAVVRLRAWTPVAGLVALSWLALAAGSRLLLEGFRGDSLLVFGGLRQAQLISLAVLLVALLGLHLRARDTAP